MYKLFSFVRGPHGRLTSANQLPLEIKSATLKVVTDLFGTHQIIHWIAGKQLKYVKIVSGKAYVYNFIDRTPVFAQLNRIDGQY